MKFTDVSAHLPAKVNAAEFEVKPLDLLLTMRFREFQLIFEEYA